MLWRDVVNLISVASGDNDMGDIDETPTSREVFANKKSIRQSEFYQADINGLKPELMFEVRYEDYNDDQKLEYKGKVYQIIRPFSKNEEILELVCKGLNTGGQDT